MAAWRAEVAMEAAVKAAAVGLGRVVVARRAVVAGVRGWEAAVVVAVVVAVEVAVVVAARVGVVAAEEGSAGWETAVAVVAVRDSEAVRQGGDGASGDGGGRGWRRGRWRKGQRRRRW